MARFTRSTDVQQGFDFDRKKQTPVGHLLSLQVGDSAAGKGVVFAQDLTGIQDPARPGSLVSPGLVAVISEFDWSTSMTGTIYIGGRIATPNKQGLMALLLGGWTDMRIFLKFNVYEYDPAQLEYFVSAGSDAVLSGLLEKQGDELTLDVENQESTEIQAPKNYAFRIGIKPGAIAQPIKLATGVGKTIVKQWGANEAAPGNQ
jgi:hypothetical protein